MILVGINLGVRKLSFYQLIHSSYQSNFTQSTCADRFVCFDIVSNNTVFVKPLTLCIALIILYLCKLELGALGVLYL